MVSQPIGGGVCGLERPPHELDESLQEEAARRGDDGPLVMGEAPRFHEAPYGEERFPMWLCARKLCYARIVP
jgi:hypothetical protein